MVVDADMITRELQEQGQPVYQSIVDRFGSGVVGPDGALDRRAVAEIVFNDDAALKDLNAIVHPAVGIAMQDRIDAQKGLDHVVILDVPLLVETLGEVEHEGGWMTPWGHLAGLIVVDTDPETAVRRLVGQRGLDEGDARARMARQATREQRLAKADFVIPNNGTRDELLGWIERCWRWISDLHSSSED